MMKKNVVVAMLGMLAFGLSLMVLTGCELEDPEAEKDMVKKGGSITVVNNYDSILHFQVIDPKGKNVTGNTHDVRARGYLTIKVAQDNDYQISYWGPKTGSKYVVVSGGGSFRVDIP